MEEPVSIVVVIADSRDIIHVRLHSPHPQLSYTVQMHTQNIPPSASTSHAPPLRISCATSAATRPSAATSRHTIRARPGNRSSEQNRAPRSGNAKGTNEKRYLRTCVAHMQVGPKPASMQACMHDTYSAQARGRKQSKAKNSPTTHR